MFGTAAVASAPSSAGIGPPPPPPTQSQPQIGSRSRRPRRKGTPSTPAAQTAAAPKVTSTSPTTLSQCKMEPRARAKECSVGPQRSCARPSPTSTRPPTVNDSKPAQCDVESTDGLTSIHVGEQFREELRKLADGLLDNHGGDTVGRQTVVAVGSGKYKYGGTSHKSIDQPRIMEICRRIANSLGVHTRLTHALIAVTPVARDGGQVFTKTASACQDPLH